MKNIFKEGQKYTIYKISEFMAITSKAQFTVNGFKENKQDNTRFDVIITPLGKRKQYLLPALTKSYQAAPIEEFAAAVFEGVEQPFLADSEGTTYSGNACYNFVGEAGEIRKWIDEKQLNPYFEKEKVVAVTKDGERAVYPELYKGGHAVIDRILQGAL